MWESLPVQDFSTLFRDLLSSFVYRYCGKLIEFSTISPVNSSPHRRMAVRLFNANCNTATYAICIVLL